MSKRSYCSPVLGAQYHFHVNFPLSAVTHLYSKDVLTRVRLHYVEKVTEVEGSSLHALL